MQTSTTKKPFFFRLEPAQLLAELIQTADRGAWITQLLIDLSTGNATTPLADTMIQEALKYSEVKRAAVQKRWDKKAIHVNTPVIHVNTSELHSNTSSSNSNSNKHIIDTHPYSEIIADLNSKGGFNFRVGEATKKLIHARFSEGFTKNDFEKVHTIKIAEWRDNAEYSKYLRPETLYGNKFQGYLNQRVIETKSKIKEWQ